MEEIYKIELTTEELKQLKEATKKYCRYFEIKIKAIDKETGEIFPGERDLTMEQWRDAINLYDKFSEIPF